VKLVTAENFVFPAKVASGEFFKSAEFAMTVKV
jgi:hypothetical protein